MLFVKGLRDGKRGLRGKTEAVIRFTLQRGEIKKRRRGVLHALRHFGHRALFSFAAGLDGLSLSLIPDAVRLLLAGLILLCLRIKPDTGVAAGPGAECRLNLPVILRLESPDLSLAVHHDGERRRLHAADRRKEETAVLIIERGERAGSVDADQPVSLRSALGRLGERLHFLIASQMRERFPDRTRSHRLKPQSLDRLLRVSCLHDVAEDQLTLASRIACIDKTRYVLTLDQLREELQAGSRLRDRLQLELRRNEGQMDKRPLAALHIVFLRNSKLQQMSYGTRHNVLITLEIISSFGLDPLHAADHFLQVGRDGGFFSDD